MEEIDKSENEFIKRFWDVTLRTMSSDLEALKKSGGNISEIQKYTIPIHKSQTIKKEVEVKNILKKDDKLISQQTSKSEEVESQSSKTNLGVLKSIFKFIGIILIIIFFFFLGYFVLPKILPQKINKQIEPQVITTTPSIIR